jgi:hypothetical protein
VNATSQSAEDQLRDDSEFGRLEASRRAQECRNYSRSELPQKSRLEKIAKVLLTANARSTQKDWMLQALTVERSASVAAFRPDPWRWALQRAIVGPCSLFDDVDGSLAQHQLSLDMSFL